MSGTRHVYGTLDMLRGLAAAIVVFVHIQALFAGAHPANGYLAVDFFFALSGFVIAHSYQRRLSDGMTPATFMMRRAVRLFPLYALATVVGIAAFVAIWSSQEGGVGNAQASLILTVTACLNLLFLPSFFRLSPAVALTFPLSPEGTPFLFVSPAWSLMCELFGNLAYANVAKLLSFPTLMGITAFSGFLLCASAIKLHDMNIGWSYSNLWGGIPRVLYSFLIVSQDVVYEQAV